MISKLTWLAAGIAVVAFAAVFLGRCRNRKDPEPKPEAAYLFFDKGGERHFTVRLRNDFESIPFCKFDSEADVAFNVETLTSKLTTPDKEIVFSKTGVPVWYSNDSAEIVVFRGIPDNKLHIFLPGSDSYTEVSHDDVDFLLFRNAKIAHDTFYCVVYNNRTRKNYLRCYPLAKLSSEASYQEFLLPSFNPPAGHTYEMEPPVFMLPFPGSLKIFAGDKEIVLSDNRELSFQKIDNCVRVLEAIALDERHYALLGEYRKRKNNDGVYFFLASQFGKREDVDGIPFNLRKSGKRAVYDCCSPENRLALFVHDIRNNHCSGLMDFGCNNIEGRMAWSQIYYLNGFMDALELYRRSSCGDYLEPVIDDVAKRLYMEMLVSDSIVHQTTYKSKAFTINRSPALFAVQSSRLLLLCNRFRKLFRPAELKNDPDALRHRIAALDDHIECFDNSREYKSGYVKVSRPYWYLAWPRGCDFPFDGVGVPFNHQNEWAYSLFETASSNANDRELEKPLNVINFYRELMLKNDEFPSADKWVYWYGAAENGWEKDVSDNKPTYKGNKALAWISFRTIDAMSVLSALPYCRELNAEKLLDSAASMIADGDLYPFAARPLLENGKTVFFRNSVKAYYSRAVVPYELSNLVWALATKREPPALTLSQLEIMYETVLKKAPFDAPAWGKTDYPGNQEATVPNAQAMLLKAEILRAKANGLPNVPNAAERLFEQLLEASNTAHDDYPGWGIPAAWDAFGDGSVNPADTKYTISTAMVIDALLDYIDYRNDDGLTRETLALCVKALEPYMRPENLSPSGMMPYSLQKSDMQYDTCNSAAYMAGVIQRLSAYLNPSEARRFTDVADRTVDALAKTMSSSGNAVWWKYTIGRSSSNDLIHACFIIYGLTEYVAFGGRLSDRIPLQKVQNHILDFADEAACRFSGLPFDSYAHYKPRSCDVGMALFLVNMVCPTLRETSASRLIRALSDYYGGDGISRYPLTSERPLFVREYECYALLGIAGSLWGR